MRLYYLKYDSVYLPFPFFFYLIFLFKFNFLLAQSKQTEFGKQVYSLSGDPYDFSRSGSENVLDLNPGSDLVFENDNKENKLLNKNVCFF